MQQLLRSFSWTLIVFAALLLSSASVQAGGIFKNGITVHNGIYSADGFGANYYFGARYNHYLSGWNYFVEAAAGFSSIKSSVLADVVEFQFFDSDGLFNYEFVFGYDHAPLNNFPYIVAGVAGVNQGGQSKFAYVLGLGKQIPLAQFSSHKNLGLRYDIRDHIFRQQINTEGKFTAHNISFTVGLQYYF